MKTNIDILTDKGFSNVEYVAQDDAYNFSIGNRDFCIQWLEGELFTLCEVINYVDSESGPGCIDMPEMLTGTFDQCVQCAEESITDLERDFDCDLQNDRDLRDWSETGKGSW